MPLETMNERKLPTVLDRLSRGPREGATGRSTRALLGLRWSDPGGDGRGASAGRTDAPEASDTTASGDTAAASSNAPHHMAVGGDTVIACACAFGARATVHIDTGSSSAVRVITAVRRGGVRSAFHASASPSGDAAASGAAGSRSLFYHRRGDCGARSGRATPNQSIPGA